MSNVEIRKSMIAKRYIILVAMLFATLAVSAQRPFKMKPLAGMLKVDSTCVVKRPAVMGHYTFGTVLDGDTIPLYQLREVTVYASGMLLTQKEIKKNAKLIRNVRLMRPYALEGKRRLDVLETEIAALPKKQRKAAIKQAEKELLRDYKGELSNYTFSQGLVLIKLIDRETNRTAYKIVGELRGSLRAGLYQTFAKLFGYNLKTKFDPQHDSKDNLIERIVISMDRGQL